MSKKKKDKKVNLTLSKKEEDNYPRDEHGFIRLISMEEYNRTHNSYDAILYDRFTGRPIPKVDEGFKNANDPTSLEIDQYYAKNGISQYLHIVKTKRNDAITNQIKIELVKMKVHKPKSYYDNDARERLEYIDIKKKSFMNNMYNILRYINYFIEFFDDDDELLNAYFTMMFQIMNADLDLPPIDFVESIYASFTTESMIHKIVRMVNYNIDPNLVKQNDRVYDESIQLTLDHLKAIIALSCIHKFIIPIVSQYYAVKKEVLEKNGWTDKDLYYYTFSAFIDSFNESFDVVLSNKLYHTATTRVTKTTNQESPMWNRRYRFGTTPTVYTSKLIREFIIDISQKVIFNKSGIIFIHVCFDKAIKNELIQPDKYEFSEMTMEASDSVNETVSRWDRWQTEKTGHSQRDRIRGIVAIDDSIYRAGLKFGINFRMMLSKNKDDLAQMKKYQDEFDFYKNYLPQPLNKTQMYIIQLYFGSILGSMEEVKMLEYNDLIRLIMVMKRDFNSRNYRYLQFFISGELKAAANKNYNKRKVDKLCNMNPCFEDLLAEYGDIFELLNRKELTEHIKTVATCPIRMVDYDYKECTENPDNNRLMYPVDSCASDDFLRLLLTI